MLYAIIEASLLILNALAILHEKRFLAQYGLTQPVGGGYEVADIPAVKSKIATALHAVRVLLRAPLIFLNLIVIVLLLLFG